jgi:hypothetical protein
MRAVSIDAAQIKQLRAELGSAAIARRLGIAPKFGLPRACIEKLPSDGTHASGHGVQSGETHDSRAASQSRWRGSDGPSRPTGADREVRGVNGAFVCGWVASQGPMPINSETASQPSCCSKEGVSFPHGRTRSIRALPVRPLLQYQSNRKASQPPFTGHSSPSVSARLMKDGQGVLNGPQR